MGLASLVRSALATAKSVTADLQATVTHEAYVSQDAYAQPTYSDGVERQAIVTYRTRLVRNAAGEEVMARASIAFVEPVSIDMRDRFTLPDGTTGPIVSMTGVADSTSGVPYAPKVWIGQDAPPSGGQ